MRTTSQLLILLVGSALTACWDSKQDGSDSGFEDAQVDAVETQDVSPGKETHLDSVEDNKDLPPQAETRVDSVETFQDVPPGREGWLVSCQWSGDCGVQETGAATWCAPLGLTDSEVVEEVKKDWSVSACLDSYDCFCEAERRADACDGKQASTPPTAMRWMKLRCGAWDWDVETQIEELEDVPDADHGEVFEDAQALDDTPLVSDSHAPNDATDPAGSCLDEVGCLNGFHCELLATCQTSENCASARGHCVPERVANCTTSIGDEWGNCDAIVGAYFDGTTCREASGCACGPGCYENLDTCWATCGTISLCEDPADCDWMTDFGSGYGFYCERFCSQDGICRGACLQLPSGSCRIDSHCPGGQYCTYSGPCTQSAPCFGACQAVASAPIP